MTKPISILLFLACPLILSSQNVQVHGGLIVDSVDANSGVVKNVADPINPQDGATKAYVDSLEDQLIELITELFEAGLITGIVSDIDGNVYKTLKIGDQVWMLENLRTTKYNDGTSIPLVTDASAWDLLSTPAYCYYDTTGSDYAAYTQDTFGALYNYFVVADTNSLNVCPVGWHVPTVTEWLSLESFLGGQGVAGAKMKQAGLTHWNSPNSGATNESGFTGMPGGMRTNSGTFITIGDIGFWWSSSEGEIDMDRAWDLSLHHFETDAAIVTNVKEHGFSVRCLRD